MATDEDLDNLLDDALDDLAEIDKQHAIPTNPPKPTPKPTPTPSASTTTTTTTSSTTAATPSEDEEELADKFASQMADILSKLQGGDLEKNIEDIIQQVGGLQIPSEENNNNGGEGSSSNTNKTTSTTEQEQADLETMLSALAALDNGANPESTASSISEKLKKIAEDAKNITDNDAGGEELESMIRDFQNNPEFQSVMEGMVNQMISKDVLYEPMKELREKYPKWLEDNRKTLSDEDYKKYIEQYNIVQKICTVYEGNTEEATPEQMQEVVQLMQDMAEYGQPPQDIIKELAPGVQIGPDGVPVFPGAEGGDPANAGCSIM